MSKFRYFILSTLLLFVLLILSRPVLACGGLFCQNTPVDQNAERIIFTQNGNGTVSAIVQIQYTGFAEDFSWILPIPAPIAAEDLQVPETGEAAFLELETATNPVIIPPPVPDNCAEIDMVLSESDSGVEVFATGEVGPYSFDVIGSEDPTALIKWLRDHQYMVTEAMEPLINVYVQEQFAFLAMRLLPDEGVQDIQPIKLTYPSERPMIPLRLTAVAANPDMVVLVWIFGQSQAVPVNYAHMEIPNDDLIFYYPFGGNNYRQALSDNANKHDGRAFVTEYAGSSRNFAFTDPLLQQLASDFPYLTRLNTVISPEEMTVDPIFDYDPQRPDVSNVRDLSTVEKDLYQCEREGIAGTTINIPFIGSGNSDLQEGEGSNSLDPTGLLVIVAGLGMVFLGFLGLIIVLLRLRRQ